MVNIRSVIPAEAGNAYAYDNVGNRTSMMVTAGGVTRTHVYAYGNIYQVTGVDYPPELSYPSAGSGRALATDSTFNEACPERSERDAAGNRSSVIDGSGTCTYTTNNLNEYTAAGTSSYEYDASGNMTADGTYSFFYDPENHLIRTTKGSTGTRTLGQALDSGLTYTTGGADGWRVDYYEDYQGMCSARSGYIGDANESYLQTQVQGAGTIKFWWKVSSEDDDYLEFWIDTTRQDLISGSVGWHQKSFTVSGTGTHTLKWRFVKDGSDSEGDDCGWVDWVQWSGPCPPVPEPASNNWGTLLYRAACPERSERDAAGRRIEKQYDWETITKYVYDGDHCIAEYDVSNNLRRKYIYGPAVDEPIAMIEAAGSYAGTYYYHCDALGSVVGLTNASGNTVEVYEYDVYGRLGASDASHPNRILFTGREYDKETGLYYYRARYYNPQIGRFLQTDPIGYDDGMNWYVYCGNSPVRNTDPSGSFRYIWGKGVTDKEKEAIEASFKRVGQRCGELMKWIDDTTRALAVEWGMQKGDFLIDELQELRYTLRTVKMGVDSNTTGLKVGFKDTGGDYAMYQTTLLSRFPGIYLDSNTRIPDDQVTMDETIMHELGHWAGLPLFDRVLPNESWMNAYRFDELMTLLPNQTKPWNLNYYASALMALNRKYPDPIVAEPPPPSNDPSDVPSWIIDPEQ